MGKVSKTAITIFITISLLGCARVTEVVKGVAGLSTKVLEDKRADAIKQTFNLDFKSCYSKVNEALKAMGSYIYARDDSKKLVAIYLSDSDTTVVGIFFSQVDSANTQLEVSSPATYAKEYIAKRIFSYLEGKISLIELKGLHNDKKTDGDK